MTFYTRMRAMVDRLLTKYGVSTTLTTTGEGTYSTTTATVTQPAPVVDIVLAAVFPYEDKFVDGTLILSTDQQAYLSAQGISEPKPGSVLLWQGKDLVTVRAKTLGPAGVNILYELQVRAP